MSLSTRDEWFAKIPEIVLMRSKGAKRHIEADCSFMTERGWITKCPPAFYYGVAHILKHKSRQRRQEIISKNRSEKNLVDLQKKLRRTMGWSDDFFWLAYWAQRRKFRGITKIDEVKSKSELFFLSLVHMEWGDLIREASYIWRKECVDTSFKPEVDDNEWFGIWHGDEGSLDVCFKERTNSRINWATEAFENIIGNPEESAVPYDFKDIVRRLSRDLFAIRARVEPGDNVENNLNKACELTINQEENERIMLILEEYIKQKKESKTPDLDEIFSNHWIASEERYKSIHFWGDWIEDLLIDQENNGVPIHPRTGLKPEPFLDIYRIENIPNPSAIKRLDSTLSKNLEWLLFVTKNSESLLSILETIEFQKSAIDIRLKMPIQEQCDGNEPNWKLYVLRDWGSYTPILPRYSLSNNVDNTGGGGYFLRYGDLGIVIDPGYDYIRHFYEAGLRSQMITHVMVTHDHYDHAASFGPLLNLLFTQRKNQSPTKNIDFLLCRGIFDQYARFIVDSRYFGKVDPLTDEDRQMNRTHSIGGNLKVITTQTRHGSKNGFGQGVGLFFDFLDGTPRIGITSDTGWYDKSDQTGKSLGDVFSELKPDVMILHLGSIIRSELSGAAFYATHLGARGVFRVIESLPECRLAVISEFGEECRGQRDRFAKQLSDHFKATRANFRCFASDRKTRIANIPDKGIFIGRGQENSSAGGENVVFFQYDKATSLEVDQKIIFFGNS
jgi:hypothetical protein